MHIFVEIIDRPDEGTDEDTIRDEMWVDYAIVPRVGDHLLMPYTKLLVEVKTVTLNPLAMKRKYTNDEGVHVFENIHDARVVCSVVKNKPVTDLETSPKRRKKAIAA